MLSYRFIDKAAVTSRMCSNALSALLLTLLPSGVAGRGGSGREIKKGKKTERYYIYLFKLVYELKFFKVTSCIKIEVQV